MAKVGSGWPSRPEEEGGNQTFSAFCNPKISYFYSRPPPRAQAGHGWPGRQGLAQVGPVGPRRRRIGIQILLLLNHKDFLNLDSMPPLGPRLAKAGQGWPGWPSRPEEEEEEEAGNQNVVISNHEDSRFKCHASSRAQADQGWPGWPRLARPQAGPVCPRRRPGIQI